MKGRAIRLIFLLSLVLLGCWASMVIDPQPGTPGTEFAYLPEEVSVVTVDMTTAATYTSLNVTEDGILSAIRVRYTVTADGLPDVDLVVTTDATAATASFYNASLIPEFPMMGFATVALATSRNGDTFWLPLDARYGTSLRVDAVVNTATTSAGEFDLAVLRSTKLATSSQNISGRGFIPQPMSVATGIELNPGVNTNTAVLDVTESGILHGVGFRIECVGGCAGSAGATIAAGTFTVTVDGTARVHTLFTAATNHWVPGITAMVGGANAVGFLPGDGSDEGDVVYLPWQLRYLTSVEFEVDINTGGVGTATMRAFALRSTEL